MKKNGFTLIELLSIIILIVIVSVIVVPAIMKASNKSKEAAYDTRVSIAKNAISLWVMNKKKCLYNNDSNCMINQCINEGESFTSAVNCPSSEINNNELYCAVQWKNLAKEGLIEADDKTALGEYVIFNETNKDDISNDYLCFKFNKTDSSVEFTN